MSGETHAVQQL